MMFGLIKCAPVLPLVLLLFTLPLSRGGPRVGRKIQESKISPPSSKERPTWNAGQGDENENTSTGNVDLEIPLNTSLILLCRKRQNLSDVGIDESSLDYLQGEPVYADINVVEASTEGTDAIAGLSALFDVGGKLGLAGFSRFTAAGPLLTLMSHHIGKSETSLLGASIQTQFVITQQEISKLKDKVNTGFGDIRRDLADSVLDEIMTTLQAIDYAYINMAASVNSTNSNTPFYSKRYREACNVPNERPEDLLRELYGYACGNNTERSCLATEGADTGTCAFGRKKLQFVYDVYKTDAKGNTLKFRAFRVWLQNAMLLALFHLFACPPADETSCRNPETDDVYQNIVNEAESALLEVAANLEAGEQCFEENFRTLINAELLQGVPVIGDCIRDGASSDTEKNACAASAAHGFVSTNYAAWDWLVVVYSFEEKESRDAFKNGDGSLVERRGGTRDEFGSIFIDDVVGLSNRFFHMMYRRKVVTTGTSFGTPFMRDYFLNSAGVDVRDLVLNRQGCQDLTCHCSFAASFWTQRPIAEFSECCSIPNIAGLVGDPSRNRVAAAREQGYIVFSTKKGIDKAYFEDSNRFQIYWGEQKIPIFTGGPFGGECADSIELII